jgi:hypothetical protein
MSNASVSIIEDLIRAGADPMATDRLDMTPIDYAVISTNGSSRRVRNLLHSHHHHRQNQYFHPRLPGLPSSRSLHGRLASGVDGSAARLEALVRCADSRTKLILWPDANEPRLMSLVPPLHVVLLDAANIYNTLHEAIAVEGWKAGLPTNALLISGPSKTADIQQTLAYGAHGPKELVVLLMGDEQ